MPPAAKSAAVRRSRTPKPTAEQVLDEVLDQSDGSDADVDPAEQSPETPDEESPEPTPTLLDLAGDSHLVAQDQAEIATGTDLVATAPETNSGDSRFKVVPADQIPKRTRAGVKKFDDHVEAAFINAPDAIEVLDAKQSSVSVIRRNYGHVREIIPVEAPLDGVPGETITDYVEHKIRAWSVLDRGVRRVLIQAVPSTEPDLPSDEGDVPVEDKGYDA